jgi:hypothetical protein
MEGSSRRQHLVELFSTILLAFAALGTAWSTYQSTRWRGELRVAHLPRRVDLAGYLAGTALGLRCL